MVAQACAKDWLAGRCVRLRCAQVLLFRGAGDSFSVTPFPVFPAWASPAPELSCAEEGTWCSILSDGCTAECTA